MRLPIRPGATTLGDLVRACGGMLLFLMVFVPTTYRFAKVALLGIVLFTLAVRALRDRNLRLRPDIVLLALGFATLGLAGIALGQFHAAPGARTMITVYVVWPLVYTFLTSGFDDGRAVSVVGVALIVAAIAVPAYSLVYVMWAAGYWPGWLYVALDQGQEVRFYGTHVEFNLYSISSLLFLTPFLIGMLAIPPRRQMWWTRPALGWVALVLNLVAVLLTGRRALLLVVGLAPLCVLAVYWLLPAWRHREARRRAIRVLAAAALITVLGITVLAAMGLVSVDGFWSMFRSGFEFTSDPIARDRNDQFWDLVDGWRAAPVFGVGHGMPAPRIVRSVLMPWAYELSYVALLYHVGVVGVGAYLFGFVWLIAAARSVAAADEPATDLLLPVLVGTAAFLVANATNPYLEKWDYLWTIFLPVALVNVGGREVRREGPPAT